MDSERQEASAEFETLVARGVDRLPEWVRAKLDNVVFVAEYAPDAEVMKAEGLVHDDELFGYYHGIPLTERGEWYGVGGVLPDRITIYQKAHETHVRDSEETLARMVEETVWHEVGHYLGLDEEQVRKRERERGHMSIEEERDQ
jgi:predicted Zn-dependent protease with MMP-like domain